MDIDYLWVAQTALGAIIGSGFASWFFKTTYQNRLNKKLEEVKTDLSVYAMQQQLKFSKFHEKQFEVFAEIYADLYDLHYVTGNLLDYKIETPKEIIKILTAAGQKTESLRLKIFTNAIYIEKEIFKNSQHALTEMAKINSEISSVLAGNDTERSIIHLEKKYDEVTELIKNIRIAMKNVINPLELQQKT